MKHKIQAFSRKGLTRLNQFLVNMKKDKRKVRRRNPKITTVIWLPNQLMEIIFNRVFVTLGVGNDDNTTLETCSIRRIIAAVSLLEIVRHATVLRKVLSHKLTSIA
jgi:hypothetical protein